MLLFYYDPLSNLTCGEQYSRYLENRSYIKNLKSYTNDPINYQLLEIKRTIEGTNATLIHSMQQNNHQYTQLMTTIHGSLERGFDELKNELEIANWKLNEIEEGIGNLQSVLDWKTDLIIEQQRVSNLYLENISGLLKIPETQKQRAHHIEQGCIWLKNASDNLDHKNSFYGDAFEEFEKALAIEKRDYFSLRQLGFVYLNSTQFFNVEKALGYFEESAKYAQAIANVTQSGSDRNVKSYYHTLNTSPSKESLLAEAAWSLYYASRCQYLLIEFRKGAELAKQAWDLQPRNPELGYQMAKCLSAGRKEDDALKTLWDVIEISPQYVKKISADPDFFTRETIISEINKRCFSFLVKVENKLTKVRASILLDSTYLDILHKIINEFNPATFLNAKKISTQLDNLFENIKAEKKERKVQSEQIERSRKLKNNADDLRLAKNIIVAIIVGPVVGFIVGLLIDTVLQFFDLLTKKNGEPDAVTNVRFYGGVIGFIIGIFMCFIDRVSRSND